MPGRTQRPKERAAYRRAARPVLRRMARDRRRVSEPVREVVDLILENLSEPEFTAHGLSADFSGDRRRALGAFTVELGLPAIDYLAEARLETAIGILLEPGLSATAAKPARGLR